jgi:p-aminobenzoyl-glutamate transporter AbgT
MIKIVPDPPLQASDSPHTLEDLLVQIAEYLVCAHTAAQHAAMIHSKLPGQVMALTAVHEIDSARGLVEMALSRVQARH